MKIPMTAQEKREAEEHRRRKEGERALEAGELRKAPPMGFAMRHTLTFAYFLLFVTGAYILTSFILPFVMCGGFLLAGLDINPETNSEMIHVSVDAATRVLAIPMALGLLASIGWYVCSLIAHKSNPDYDASFRLSNVLLGTLCGICALVTIVSMTLLLFMPEQAAVLVGVASASLSLIPGILLAGKFAEGYQKIHEVSRDASYTKAGLPSSEDDLDDFEKIS